ncbi:MAG: hypothetical protein WBD16_09245 [Pyrinomonadaceae bacterium]
MAKNEQTAKVVAQRRAETLAQYRKNADVLLGWRWLAAKQARTCDYCLGMDGQQFPLHVDFEPMNKCEKEYCRCTIVAVIEGVD